jgi:hypothetical protein
LILFDVDSDDTTLTGSIFFLKVSHQKEKQMITSVFASIIAAVKRNGMGAAVVSCLLLTVIACDDEIVPTGSFLFDDGTTQGWVLHGPFDGATEALTGCHITLGWATGGHNSPTKPSNGALNIFWPSASLDTCLPRTPASGNVCIEFESPELTWDTDTRDVRKYNFYLYNTIGGKVQPMLKVRKDDGTETFLREVDAHGDAIFQNITSGWHHYSFTNPNPSYHVLKVFIRVWMSSADIAMAGRVDHITQLDFVTPFY